MIRAATPNEVEYVCSQLPIPYQPGIKGVINAGAMVLYDGWTPNAVQLHVYSTGPRFLLDPVYIKEIFTYPFVQCGKSLAYVVTPANAEASLKVSRALGFREVFRQKDGWDVGIDMIVKEMRKEDCKWIRSTH